MNTLGSGENQVREAADKEAQPLSEFLRGWLDRYQRHQDGIGPRLGDEIVHQNAGTLGADAGFSHDRLSEKTYVSIRTVPTADNGTACKNESPEAATGGLEQ
jgi:hypothetical protein